MKLKWIIGIIVVLGIAIVLFQGSKKPSQSTAELMTYKNMEFGISFKYPADFTVLSEYQAEQNEKESAVALLTVVIGTDKYSDGVRIEVLSDVGDVPLKEVMEWVYSPVGRHPSPPVISTTFGDMPEAYMIPTSASGITPVYTRTVTGRVVSFLFTEIGETDLRRILENSLIAE